MRAIIEMTESRICRLIFKQAVESAMIENILTVVHDLNEEDVERLRGDCIDIVKQINGTFRFEDAIKWQNK